MPIIASWKLERKRSSLSRAVASASSLLSRTLSLRRQDTIAASPAARHERGVDRRPLPRVGDRVGVVEHLVAAERGPMPWWSDHVERREQERDPVLVEREDGDHHEEVEVRLDVAARDVDDERGRGQQAGGGDRRAQLAAARPVREHGGERPRAPRRAAQCQSGKPSSSAEDEQAGGVEPQQPEHPAVALLPVLIGERPALGQEVSQAAHETSSADVRPKFSQPARQRRPRRCRSRRARPRRSASSACRAPAPGTSSSSRRARR